MQPPGTLTRMPPEADLSELKKALQDFLKEADGKIRKYHSKGKQEDVENVLALKHDYSDGLMQLANLGQDFALKSDVYTFGILMLQVSRGAAVAGRQLLQTG